MKSCHLELAFGCRWFFSFVIFDVSQESVEGCGFPNAAEFQAERLNFDEDVLYGMEKNLLTLKDIL